MKRGRVLVCVLALGLGLSGSDISKPGNGYVTNPSSNTLNPADSTTYYFGCFPSQAPQTTAAFRRCYLPSAGTVTRVFLTFVCTTPGSAETSTINLRLNNTTDTAITAGVQNNATLTVYDNQALSITVVAGDYFELKWVTPAYGTNPTSVLLSAIVYVQ